MKIKNAFKIGAIATLLGLTVLGCKLNPSKIKKEYVKTETVTVDKEEILLDLGKIIREEFKIHYSVYDDVYWAYYDNSEASGNHRILYVKVSNMDDGENWMIYPYSRPPIESGNADIQYWSLPEGRISTDKFVKIFILTRATSDPDNFYIDHIKGIIVPDSTGIVYK